VSEPRVYRRSRVVAAEDVDFLGHVNNVVWLRFVIALSDAHARERPEAGRLVREHGGQWIVRRHELDYQANAGIGEEIAEETWVESMKGARSFRACRFTGPDGQVLLESMTQWAFVDAKTLRPIRIPRPLIAFFLKD
jgi:acyl-CoA thioester hydrolase